MRDTFADATLGLAGKKGGASMLRRVLSVVVLSLALAGASAAVATSSHAGGLAEGAALPRPFVVYDRIGDATGALDITSVAVARDAQERLTFAINVANHASMKRGEVYSLGIDVDRRLGTGSESGVDVVLELDWPAGTKEPVYTIGTWDGSGWQSLDVAAEVAYDAHGLRFSVGGGDIGVGRSFRLAALVGRLAARTMDDRVPEAGLVLVTLDAPAEIGAFGRLIIPFPALMPEAGKIMTVRGIEIGVDQDQAEIAPGISVGSVVRPEKVRCTAKIGQVQLVPVGVCAWRVPRTARGKTLMLKVSVAYRGDEWTGVYPLEVG